MSFLNAGSSNPYQQCRRRKKVPSRQSRETHVTNDHAFIAGKRCLVLDDEFLIALDIQQALEAAGARVTSFSSAAQALAALYGGAMIDVAVLDIKLGKAPHSSLAVAHLLSERGTPFVFLTGMAADNADAKQFPAAPVVEKPYRIEALMEALRRALRANGEPEPDRAA
jgi:CheY-like chemotaxis protein